MSYLSNEKCPYCHGCDGKAKDVYKTEFDAQQRARHIRLTRGTSLRVYPCPSGNGWHLTKEQKGGEHHG